MIVEPCEVTQPIPRVWVIQEGNNDYSSAESFGEVRFITHSDLRTTRGSRQTDAVVHDVRKFLTEYVQGLDFIIPVGNPMITVLLSMVLSDGDHKFLKWDGRQSLYIPYTLNSKMIK